MNYMNMISFIENSQCHAISRLACDRKEEFFRHHFKKIKILPNFILLEASFQTAGRILRENESLNHGMVIASYRDFNFSRPIFADEICFIKANLINFSNGIAHYTVSITDTLEANDTKIGSGKIMMASAKAVKKGQISSSSISEVESNIQQFRFV